jgi:hypothetical protein
MDHVDATSSSDKVAVELSSLRTGMISFGFTNYQVFEKLRDSELMSILSFAPDAHAAAWRRRERTAFRTDGHVAARRHRGASFTAFGLASRPRTEIHHPRHGFERSAAGGVVVARIAFETMGIVLKVDPGRCLSRHQRLATSEAAGAGRTAAVIRRIKK